jgi:hypothetical protein
MGRDAAWRASLGSHWQSFGPLCGTPPGYYDLAPVCLPGGHCDNFGRFDGDGKSIAVVGASRINEVWGTHVTRLARPLKGIGSSGGHRNCGDGGVRDRALPVPPAITRRPTDYRFFPNFACKSSSVAGFASDLVVACCFGTTALG